MESPASMDTVCNIPDRRMESRLSKNGDASTQQWRSDALVVKRVPQKDKCRSFLTDAEKPRG